MQYTLRFTFDTTNNEVEYEALCARLRIVDKLKVQNLTVFFDPQIVNQLQGQYQAKKKRMKLYLEKVDKSSKLTTNSPAQLGQIVHVEELTSLTMERKVSLTAEVEEPEDCWMIPFLNYLIEESLPPDKALAKKVKLKSPQYIVVQDRKLYRRSYLRPILRCVRPL